MSKNFHSKKGNFTLVRLAVTNIKSNSKTYIPFSLTCICTIVLFYNMCFLANNTDFSESAAVLSMLNMGVIVTAIFSAIFLFYTNSFLIKRRKKEFGLFNILGMEKKHIARIIIYETFLTGLVSVIIGLAVGILFSKLMSLLLAKLIYASTPWGFEISLAALLITVILFAIIFTFNLIYNLCQVHLSKPIELLNGGNVGEKEPKTKIITAILGAICLGIGYYIAISTEDPTSAISAFLVAVIAVIIGTYLIFISGSIAILKLLRKNKKLYYKLKNFTTISGMMYRMKQNAAGLASICILSTAVIVVISTTFSMYIGIGDILKTKFPQNITVQGNFTSAERVKLYDKTVEENIIDSNYNIKEKAKYTYLYAQAIQDGSKFTVAIGDDANISDLAILTFFTIDDYNSIHGKSEILENNESLLYAEKGDVESNELIFGDYKIIVKDRFTKSEFIANDLNSIISSYTIIVKDNTVINEIKDSLDNNKTSAIEVKDGQTTKSGGNYTQYNYYYGFTPDCDAKQEVSLANKIQESLKAADENTSLRALSLEEDKPSVMEMYGSFLFIGIFLGILFIMATVLIIYYKQIAEGYDDQKRFEIMQKVGMSHSEVRKAIHSQVITVFFLPLVMAIIHLSFAFGIIVKILKVFRLTNVMLFGICTLATILIFAIFYTITYLLTARTYYKIVSKK